MIPEIIDLTGGESPPSPPSRSLEGPTILNFANSTTTAATASVWPPSMHIYDPSLNPSHRYYHSLQQPSNDNNNGSSFFFQPYMHADHHQHQHQAAATAVTTPHEPVSESQQIAFMSPHPNNNCLTATDDWTLRDHELFTMGLSKYGRGSWNKIASHYLSNKTPQQVESYANNFFYNNFRRRNSSSSIHSHSSSTAPSFTSYSSWNNNNNDEPITLMLLPDKKENDSREVFAGETATANNTVNSNYACGLLFGMMPTTTAIGETSSSSMRRSRNYHGEIDLDLRLGRN